MKRSTQIITAQHSLLCNQVYLELLKTETSQSEYILTIKTNTQLATDRLYRNYVSNKISLDEYNESKAIVIRIHNQYLKRGVIYA